MSERVQLNLSILREEKLALQALAEGRGVSVTRLVLSLVYGGGSVRGRGLDGGGSAAEARGGGQQSTEGAMDSQVGSIPTPPVIQSPGEVPAAVERVAPDRTFRPYSKDEQAGRKPRPKKGGPF